MSGKNEKNSKKKKTKWDARRITASVVAGLLALLFVLSSVMLFFA